MREIRTSGLMSGEGKRGRWPCLNATAPFLDSTSPKSLPLRRLTSPHDPIISTRCRSPQANSNTNCDGTPARTVVDSQLLAPSAEFAGARGSCPSLWNIVGRELENVLANSNGWLEM